TYGALVCVMLGVSHLVAHEARSKGAGLAAMSCMGITTVVYPATTWYSAGQTLWAALASVVCLVSLQFWLMNRRIYWFISALFTALTAPLLWGGGLVAGIAGSAYLLVAGEAQDRRRAWLPLASSVLVAGAVIPFGWTSWTQSRNDPTVEPWDRPVRTLTH